MVDLLLVDEGQGLAQVLVEDVQLVRLLDVRPKDCAIRSSDLI